MIERVFAAALLATMVASPAFAFHCPRTWRRSMRRSPKIHPFPPSSCP